MQFSIRLLLAATALVAVGAAGGWWGIVAAGLMAACWGFAESWADLLRRVSIVVLSVLFGFCMFAVIARERLDFRRSYCETNLRVIGLALHMYHEVYGSFPPAYTVDAEGNRLHSWRTLILPFIEQEALFARFRLDEPWDSFNNLGLAAQRPPSFACPSERQPTRTDTSYLAVVGPEAPWEGEQGMAMAGIPGEKNAVVLVVEATPTGIAWSEPRDLSYEEAVAGINREHALSISSPHEKELADGTRIRGAWAYFADGSVGFLDEELPGKQLASLLSRRATFEARHSPRERRAESRAAVARWAYPPALLAAVLWFAFELRRCRRGRPGVSKPEGPGPEGELSGT